MKFQALSETPKVSSAKLGIYCSIFCLVAGIAYGNLESISYPVNSFAKGLISFSSALFWGGAICSFFLLKQGKKFAPLVLLGVYAINIFVSLYAVNICGMNKTSAIQSSSKRQIESTNLNPSHLMLRDDIKQPDYYDPSKRSD